MVIWPLGALMIPVLTSRFPLPDFRFRFDLWFENFACDVPVRACFCLKAYVRRGLFEDFIEPGGPLRAELGSQLAVGAQEV